MIPPTMEVKYVKHLTIIHISSLAAKSQTVNLKTATPLGKRTPQKNDDSLTDFLGEQ